MDPMGENKNEFQPADVLVKLPAPISPDTISSVDVYFGPKLCRRKKHWKCIECCGTVRGGVRHSAALTLQAYWSRLIWKYY